MKKIQVVAENHEGQRMDSALVELLPEYSRTAIQRWVKEGQVSVGGKVVKSSYKVEAGQEILIEIPEVKESTLVAQDLSVPILYEDEDLVVVNKPRGLVVILQQDMEMGLW